MSRRSRLAVSLLASISFARTLTGGPTLAGVEKPDLVVETQKAAVAGRFAFVVRNTGNADAHSSRLKVSCEDVVKAPALACTAATNLIDVPPIPKGGSFSTPDMAVTSAGASATPKGPPYYRLRITAEADVEGKVAESNERNNSALLVLENFQGPMPPLSVSTQANVGVSFGLTPIVQPSSADIGSVPEVGPKMTIEPEHPLTFTASDWILVRNKGPVDYGGGSARLLSCTLVKRAGGAELPCNSDLPNVPLKAYPTVSFVQVPVPPLKAGSFQPLFELPASKAPPALQAMYRAKFVFRLVTGNSHKDFTIESQ